MKKFLVVLLFSICHLSMQALIGKYTLNSQHKDSADNVSQPYELIVSEPNDNNEILINFRLNQVNIIPNSLQHGKELVLIDGFDQTLIAEEPALPVRNISFAIQQNEPCEIEILSSDFSYIPCDLSAAIPPHADSDPAPTSILPIKKYSGYNSDTLLSYSDMQTYRGKHIHNLMISPVSYSVSDSMLRICTSFFATIKCETDYAPKLSANSSFDNYTFQKLYNNGSYIRPVG
ncbi:MAG: hypothetical protein SOT19_07570 [Muribaculaceae bacterium]|nr:hypothetical protein [Muribaculaceae bacterium]